MVDEPRDSSSISDDPVSYMLSIAIELHEMKKALVDSGFTDKEALYLVGQAVAAGVMLPIVDFSPEDFPSIKEFPEEDDGEDLV